MPHREHDWSAFRRDMPVTERWAYFDHAAVAPLSGPARQAILRWAEEAARQGDTVWPQWAARLEEIRRTAAAMIAADPAEIAFVRNTTEGVSLIAEGFPWQAGDNVVTLEDEFPSNQYPWLNLASRGVECRRVPVPDGRVDVARIDQACDERTRIVSASWVGYASGWRNDLHELADVAHRRGALLFVDAIQALGVFPLDVGRTPIDFLAADGHKWLLGPEGAGLLFIRREHLDRLRPLGVGWHSVRHAHDFSRIELRLKPSAQRYEGGSQNMPGLLALGASLDLLAAHGAEALSRRVLEIAELACRRLEAIGATISSHRDIAAHCSGIVSFEMVGKSKNPDELRRACLDSHVALSARAGRLRISPHAYNDENDVDRLIRALQAV